MYGSGPWTRHEIQHTHVCYPFLVTVWLLMNCFSLNLLSLRYFPAACCCLGIPYPAFVLVEPVCAVLSAYPQILFCESQFNPWATENSRTTKKPTQKFSYQSNTWNCSRVSKLPKSKKRRGDCSQQEREVSSLLPAATSCCVSCPGSTGFSGILKFNQAASKSLLTIINKTRSRWELQETGKPKTCVLKRIQVWTLELVSVAGRIKDLKSVFHTS